MWVCRLVNSFAKQAIIEVLTGEQAEQLKRIMARLADGSGDGMGDSGSVVRVRTRR